jgi:tetratricopeptide (TPR) repeat protein
MPQFKYHAFISYSHQDSRWGAWLHKALETYPIPQRLVGRQTAAGTIPKKLTPIFRDRDELPSAHDLGRKVNEALAQSANLVVICSPHSAASRWVDEEVREFKRLGREERVFCLIVDGEPNASDNVPGNSGGSEAEECFAPALRFQLDADGGLTTLRTEPIAADVRPGKDGKANARLKLVSGLLDVGFDELRQREQQRAHRKLAWVAGLALAGMLVATGLAAFALHARNQAQFQREQAENLVGFMLGNLRDKLEAVTRLDILDEVADHAMDYFDAQGEDSGSNESRAMRADALLMIGRVRLGQGKYEQAEKAFDESLHIATVLLKGQPADPARKIAVADAHSWLGQTAWQRGDLAMALAHFEAAQPIVDGVVAANAGNREWLTRLYWSHSNIGHVFEQQGDLQAALREYNAALGITRRQVAGQPADDTLKTDLLTAHDALGQVNYRLGNFAASEQHYKAEQGLLLGLVGRQPGSNEWKQDLAFTETYLAQVAEARGHSDVANASLKQALQIGEEFLVSDPTDMDKVSDVAAYCRRLARNLRLRGDSGAAASLLKRADALYRQVLAKSPEDARARSGKDATTLEQARLAWQDGEAVHSRASAVAARDSYAASLRERKDDRSAALGMARAQLLLGVIDASTGNAPRAAEAWAQGLEATRDFGADSRDPDQIAVQAELLHRLGRDPDAGRLVARLDAMGYRDREYMAWVTAIPADKAIGGAEVARDKH